MPAHRIRARPPRGEPRPPATETDPELLQGFLEDAAHHPGGHASSVIFPETEAEVAVALRSHRHILPIGAQSSLTGGATPAGDAVLSLVRLTRIHDIGPTRVRVGAGVPVQALQDALAGSGRWYPPVPTFTGAFVGGTISTNAAGAATFKYGSTRAWVEDLTVILPSGDVLDLARGEVAASDHGRFEIETGSGVVTVPIPTYTMPDVPKCSAGYFAAPGMDLVDLFVGAEGTLGVITGATLRVLDRIPDRCFALVPVASETDGLRLVTALRAASQETWQTRDPRGIDVCAIEHMDRRAIDVLVEDGQDKRHGVSFPPDAAMALLIQVELAVTTTAEEAYAEIGSALDPGGPDTPLARLARLLADYGALERTELALPGDARRREQLLAIREAVPTSVNRRVAIAKREIDPSLSKTAADVIVPFERFAEMMARTREAFERRGLDYAVWGHISDGNVHPNLIPRARGDKAAAYDAILELGRAAIALGGCPLAEHGVGRSPIKQALLAELYGRQGIDEMRRVKRALDPEWKLGAGVVFSRFQEPWRHPGTL
jgi:D-lactate dehydrogenase (cytochrome)